MKKKLFILFLSAVLIPQITFAEEIQIEGIYRGENLYVQNPFSATGVGFCIYEVRINGQLSTDEINSSAFEVDLSVFNFKHGDKITIIVKHKRGCTPKILNPEVLKHKSTFVIKYITVSKEGYLRWATTSERGQLDFYVEQFRWKKWTRLGKVKGKGIPSLNHYSKKVSFHTGLNKFRVRQVNPNGKSRFSPDVKYMNLAMPVASIPGNGKKVSTKISFTANTKYEIYDYYGRLKKRGFGKVIDVSKYKKGTYFINFDNSTETFVKK